MCDSMLELNLSSLVLLVSLLAAYMPHAIPHIRICSIFLQAIVTFGQSSVEDLELRSEKNAGETQTFNYSMNGWLKSLISLKPHGLNRCKYQSASRGLCWAPQWEYPSCQVETRPCHFILYNDAMVSYVLYLALWLFLIWNCLNQFFQYVAVNENISCCLLILSL